MIHDFQHIGWKEVDLLGFSMVRPSRASPAQAKQVFPWLTLEIYYTGRDDCATAARLDAPATFQSPACGPCRDIRVRPVRVAAGSGN